MNKSHKPPFLVATDFPAVIDPSSDEESSAQWSFLIKSYQINITNMEKEQHLNYAAGILITDNAGGLTGNGQYHAVLQFFWTADNIPSTSLHPNGVMIHLNYTVAEYEGIIQLLQSKSDLSCYFKPAQNYGGIVQITPVSR